MIIDNYTGARILIYMGKPTDEEPSMALPLMSNQRLDIVDVGENLRMALRFTVPLLSQEERLTIVRNMKERGGSFADAIGEALLVADPENTEKLLAVFGDLIEKYK